VAPQTPLGTGFTYQGQLKNASGPINGSCDMQFSLWDAAGNGSPPAGGAQIGITQTLSPTVTNGLFTAVLNSGNGFGNSAFAGEARWLQIAVSYPAGSGGAHTILRACEFIVCPPSTAAGFTLTRSGQCQAAGLIARICNGRGQSNEVVVPFLT